MPIETEMTVKRIFLRVALYFGVALGALAAIAFAVFVSVRFKFDVPVRWVGLAAYTSLIIWFIHHQYKRLARNRLFWPAVLLVVGLHLAVFTTLLIYIPDWRLGWFLPTAFIEIAIITVILEKVFHPLRN